MNSKPECYGQEIKQSNQNSSNSTIRRMANHLTT